MHSIWGAKKSGAFLPSAEFADDTPKGKPIDWKTVRDKIWIQPRHFTFEHKVVMKVSPEAPSFHRWVTLGDRFGFGNADIEPHSSHYILNKYVDSDGKVKWDLLRKQCTFYSDDTVLCRMTDEACIKTLSKSLTKKPSKIIDRLTQCAGKLYVNCTKDDLFGRRFHGDPLKHFIKDNAKGKKPLPYVPFRSESLDTSTDCAAAMRTFAFGYYFSDDASRDVLLKAALLNGALTNPNPIGFLGGVVTALMTAYATEDIPVFEWPNRMMQQLDRHSEGGKKLFAFAIEHIPDAIQHQEDFSASWDEFFKPWNFYRTLRFECQHIDSFGTTIVPEHLQKFDDTVEGRELFYHQISMKRAERQRGEKLPYPFISDNKEIQHERDGIAPKEEAFGLGCWPGQYGHEATIIGYDSITLAIRNLVKDHEEKIHVPLSEIKLSDVRKLLNGLGDEAKLDFFGELIIRACFHGGDSDSTGAIALGIIGSGLQDDCLPRELLD